MQVNFGPAPLVVSAQNADTCDDRSQYVSKP